MYTKAYPVLPLHNANFIISLPLNAVILDLCQLLKDLLNIKCQQRYQNIIPVLELDELK